eukprot:scaffold109473_cov33-Tisochrysis_lutea.AAC.5
MRAAGHRPCVMSYTAAMKPSCAAGDVSQAVALLRDMESDFDAEAATRRSATLRGSNSSSMRGKKRKKKKPAASANGGCTNSSIAGRTPEDFTPNVRTANTFLRGCMVAGCLPEACQLFDKLGRQGMPDTITCERGAHAPRF